MTAQLLQQIEDRKTAAVDEGLEQLACGWLPHEVVAVLEDAAAVIGDLVDQANGGAS
jgi:hypothetical protein